jgi:hypothetical protein
MNYSKLNSNYKGNVEFLYAKISANLIHFFSNTSLDEHKDIFGKLTIRDVKQLDY